MGEPAGICCAISKGDELIEALRLSLRNEQQRRSRQKDTSWLHQLLQYLTSRIILLSADATLLLAFRLYHTAADRVSPVGHWQQNLRRERSERLRASCNECSKI